MKMTVPAHDLEGLCVQNGTTMAQVSENTGIPVHELQQFAAGELALSARDRQAILDEVVRFSPVTAPRELMPRTRAAVQKLSNDTIFEDLHRDVLGEDPE